LLLPSSKAITMPDPLSHPVRLLHYDPQWPQEFQQTRSSLLFASQGWVEAVEHIGSTAIGGLVSRPTVDVVAGVTEPAGLDAASPLIEGLNFRRHPLPDWAVSEEGEAAGDVLLIKPRGGEPTHRVFLTHWESPLWRRLLAVRDWLQADLERAVDFEAGKIDRWKRCLGDPVAYAEAKGYLFAELEEAIGRDVGGRGAF
jgi:GrpB-like predicted nucleotidyltransferase (UPF0157 family)